MKTDFRSRRCLKIDGCVVLISISNMKKILFDFKVLFESNFTYLSVFSLFVSIIKHDIYLV